MSTDKEKNRLNEVFTHKGGKALPDELLHPVGTRERGDDTHARTRPELVYLGMS